MTTVDPEILTRKIITSNEEKGLCFNQSFGLFVCLFVCLFARLFEKLQTDYDPIFDECMTWGKSVTFWRIHGYEVRGKFVLSAY